MAKKKCHSTGTKIMSKQNMLQLQSTAQCLYLRDVFADILTNTGDTLREMEREAWLLNAIRKILRTHDAAILRRIVHALSAEPLPTVELGDVNWDDSQNIRKRKS